MNLVHNAPDFTYYGSDSAGNRIEITLNRGQIVKGATFTNLSGDRRRGDMRIGGNVFERMPFNDFMPAS